MTPDDAERILRLRDDILRMMERLNEPAMHASDAMVAFGRVAARALIGLAESLPLEQQLLYHQLRQTGVPMLDAIEEASAKP